jgi:uncharacterized membrane protein YfcA
MDIFLIFILVGFTAQIIDGALGMAYGVTASSILMGLGLPPATVSATVHAAECFSTGASALSHRAFGNIDKALFKRLLLPGILGAVIGAYVLSSLDGDLLKPYIALYLMLMGVIILIKAFRTREAKAVTSHLGKLGFFGAFIDAIGGGGWGPIVATNLLVRGNDIRKTVGTVNAVEFFVTLAASVTFFITLGFGFLNIIAGLAIGSIIAAPFGAWICARIPVKPFMIAVGALVTGLSLYNFIKIVF